MKSTGVTRGQLRPHFAGRPPFLVAALLVGLGILGISYWSLSSQCSSLESELRFALQRKESVEDSMQNQLQSKDETYKVDLQKKEEEILKVNEQIKNKEKELTSVNDQINTLKESQVSFMMLLCCYYIFNLLLFLSFLLSLGKMPK